MWRMDDAQTGEMLAAATLELRSGVAALGDIAVQDKVRGNGCGTVMLHTVIEEAQSRGVETLWACAKEPDFYLHRGWQTADWDASPDIAAYCSTCEKKDSLCHPKKMKLSLIVSPLRNSKRNLFSLQRCIFSIASTLISEAYFDRISSGTAFAGQAAFPCILYVLQIQIGLPCRCFRRQRLPQRPQNTLPEKSDVFCLSYPVGRHPPVFVSVFYLTLSLYTFV